jgi:polar amino acid transport system permease protein
VFANFTLFLSTLLRGVPLTVGATGGGIVLTILLSFAAGMAMLSRSRVVRFVARVYVEGWRGTSEVVQLFWIYFAVPLLVGFQLVPLWAGILVLGLNHGAYGAEIVRGAVNAVPRAQQEAAIALNLAPAQRMRKVILPQAFVEMVPPFNNLFIQLLKSSSLLSLITVTEITNQGVQVLVPNYTGQALTIFLMMLALYLILSAVITVVMRLVERWAARVAGRSPTAGARVSEELGI